MSLTRLWEGNKEDWGISTKSATVSYTGPWSSRAADKNTALASTHPDYATLRAITDSIEPFGGASDAGGPMTAKHTVTYQDPTGNPDDKNNQPQNALSDWQEHWEVGGEAITVGLGFKWSSDNKKVTKEDVSAIKVFPTATIAISGTTNKLNSTAKGTLLNLVGKTNTNAVTIKGYSYPAKKLLYLGTGADELGEDSVGSDLYKMAFNYAYRHSNTWNQFWRDDKAGGPGWDTLVDAAGKAVYEDAGFSDMDPKNW